MNTKPVEIVYIIDRSGSMQQIASDAIGGFNQSLQDNRKMPDPANVTVVLFNGGYEFAKNAKEEKLYRVPLDSVDDLTNETFKPSGSTALNDAIGRTLSEFRRMKNEEKIDKAIFVILTDGQENSSVEFSSAEVKNLVKKCEEEFAWDFIFLAANQDAFVTGQNYGLSAQNVATYGYNTEGVRTAFSSLNTKIADYRASVTRNDSNEDILNNTRSTTLQDNVSSAD